jgi:hypothetical protein
MPARHEFGETPRTRECPGRQQPELNQVTRELKDKALSNLAVRLKRLRGTDYRLQIEFCSVLQDRSLAGKSPARVAAFLFTPRRNPGQPHQKYALPSSVESNYQTSYSCRGFIGLRRDLAATQLLTRAFHWSPVFAVPNSLAITDYSHSRPAKLPLVLRRLSTMTKAKHTCGGADGSRTRFRNASIPEELQR